MTKPSLIVLDDEPDFCDFVSAVAKSLDYEVTIFTEPRRFMDGFAAISPEIVVLDVVMPDIDGIEIAQWLAQHGAQTHVLLVTGFNPHYAESGKVLAELNGLASVRTLAKPISAGDLRSAIAALYQSADTPSDEAPPGA
ncbi:MAG: response regulator [Alphaproteobacteria bacterium]